MAENANQPGEYVKRLLQEAFSDVPCPAEWEKLGRCEMTHEDCLYFRKSFYNYEPDEIHYLLPFLLVDLIDTRTGDDVQTEDAEYLIFQLDPLRDEGVFQEVTLRQFKDFTIRQAWAICEWLKLAKSWPDLRIFGLEVEAAIAYWCRAETPTID